PLTFHLFFFFPTSRAHRPATTDEGGASNCDLANHQDSVGLLSNLKLLDVSGSRLRVLPDTISKCRSLVELDASYNALVYLPTGIGHELEHLQTLCVHLNKHRSLPSSICEMRSLHILNAHFNELRGLRPPCCHRPALRAGDAGPEQQLQRHVRPAAVVRGSGGAPGPRPQQ
ncbi:unnamed protein product, partial [Urochloa humidicola]